MSGQQPGAADPPARREVSVGVGEEFEVAVDDLPSGGYRWVPVEVPDALDLLSDTVLPADPRLVGGATRRTFRVRAQRPGAYVLRLTLVRPWESPETHAPVATTVVDVQVHG